MDDGTGNFKQLNKEELEKEIEEKGEEVKQYVFQKKEVLKIKGSTFRIKSIGKGVMILKLLPRIEDEDLPEECPEE